jgi:RNA polymerase sigma factor (sigma-70 family)
MNTDPEVQALAVETEQAAEAALELTESLHHEHGENLRRFVLKRLRCALDPDEAQDVQQDIYIELMQVPDVRLVRNPRAYLYGIAARVVGRVLNKRLGQPLILEARELTELSDAITAATQGDGHESEFDREQRWKRVLRKVPRQYREVVALRYRGTYNAEEIAAILGLTVNTVRTYSKFGTRALREALKIEEDARRRQQDNPPPSSESTDSL